MKIKILDENVANAIAAGEVVENPSLLVKELIENSLDAKASKLLIDVEKNGRNVKVNDNGTGMVKEDIFLSVERHATSKIFTKNDIYNLMTFGFRGEALASISSVSKLTISSKVEDEEIGNKVQIYGGNIKKVEDIVKETGTQIEVKDLFYNTPARLKFLRTKTTEYIKIRDIVTKLALANFDVSFKLILDGRVQLETSGKGIKNTIAEIFGIKTVKNITQFKHGFLGNLNLTKTNKNYIFSYFNKRNAKSIIVEKAIIDGYGNRLMKGKYPFVILFFEIDPSRIDVNIHPSKKIVKFDNERDIYNEIKSSIEKQFSVDETVILPNIKIEEDKNEFKENKLFVNRNYSIKNNINEKEFEYIAEKKSNLSEISIDDISKDEIPMESKRNINSENKYLSEESNKQSDTNYRIIGQHLNSYIIIDNKGELEIFDQHVVHERILYEKLMKKFTSNSISVQKLLVPIKYEIDSIEKEIIFDNMELFEKFGFLIEEFGHNVILIRGIPAFDFRESIKNIFLGILENIKSEREITDIREKIIISMSCKGAIKAGEKLEFYEMKELLDQLFSFGKFTCPHGRPIYFKISNDDIEKKFGRK